MEDAKDLSSLKSQTKDQVYKKSPKIVIVKVVVVVEVVVVVQVIVVVVLLWFYLFKINERCNLVKVILKN